MPELRRLRANDAPAVLAFEVTNRTYFAKYISDRGDDYFLNFTEQHNAQIAEQETGSCVYHVLVDDDGAILGRFNLYEVHDGTAVVGYRIAESVAGRGVATAFVHELCQLAATKNDLQILSAAVSDENIASKKVLTSNGFVAVGSAEPGGHAGTLYRRILTEK
jgi:ribosomal-protein-alanine N-acetyltransferase